MKSFLLIFTVFFVLNTNAQYDIEDIKNDTSVTDPKINWFNLKQHIYVGGEIGLSFSNGSSYINLAPIIGYDITERFSAGASIMYQLWRFKNQYTTYNHTTFGAGVFARLRPVDPLILQLEFDLYNTVNYADLSFDRVNVPALMAGFGYANSVGDGAYYQIMILYDFINNPNMPLPPILFAPLHLKLGFIWHLG